MEPDYRAQRASDLLSLVRARNADDWLRDQMAAADPSGAQPTA
jgi:hypothetical protein